MILGALVSSTYYVGKQNLGVYSVYIGDEINCNQFIWLLDNEIIF